VIAVGNNSLGLESAGGLTAMGMNETLANGVALAVDLVQALDSVKGGSSSNVELTQAVLSRLDQAMAGESRFTATVAAHSRGAADAENAASNVGGFRNLNIIAMGPAALPTSSNWKSARAVKTMFDPVVWAASYRQNRLGGGDVGPRTIREVGHGFLPKYLSELGSPTSPLSIPWTDLPDAQSRPVFKR
jgi:hypothetical protein